jgi:hypothetical protein
VEDDRNEMIRTPEQAQNVVRSIGAPAVTMKRRKYNHMDVANQFLKLINSSIKDPFVRKVMTLRILGPAVAGRERSYVSIAIELGAPESDVIQADQYGIELVKELFRKTESQEFIDKFNSARAVADAVQNMGKSAPAESQNKE